jgi:carbamoyltransferase
MKFLGLRLCDHDSNISYTDGTTVKYIKSERPHQIKHHGYTDFSSYQADIAHWNIDYSTLDAVCIVVDEIKLDFPKENVLWQLAPQFLPSISCPVYIIDHHYAHSLSCWPVIDVDTVDTAFVFDGVGDFSITNSIFKKDQRVSCSTESGIGVLLSMWGRAAGIQGHPLDISGKVMALKSYGKVNNEFVNNFSNLDILKASTVFDLYHWIPYLKADITGFESIKPGSLDWIASIHQWLENKIPEYFLKFADPDDVITFSGGVAQNICINSRLKSVFKNLHVIPHNPDDGLSLGCVEFLRRKFNQPKFDNKNFPFWQNETVPDEPTDDTIEEIAQYLAEGKIVGWYQGQGEIGPRALGNRSILMRPDIANGKDIINQRVKFREEFRPFGCSVLEQHAADYFECDYSSPYMLYSVPVKNPVLLASITHVDGTSRIQTVNNSDNRIFYKLLEKFYNKTGLPILLNTSLNVNKKPIAFTQQHAMDVLNQSALDALCIGDRLFVKSTPAE